MGMMPGEGTAKPFPPKIKDPYYWQNPKGEYVPAFLWLQFLERLSYLEF